MTAPLSPSSGPAALPTVDRTALPREVREGGREERRAYASALGFERMLLGQLTEALGAAARGPGGGAQDEMLPDALADAVIAHGGTGLAGQLYRALRVAEAR